MGLSREVTNRIQRLRKTSGISIDDQIEIYYQFEDAAKTVAQAVVKYADRVFQQTRMPFISIDELQPNQVKIGETEFVNPDDEKDTVKLYIYLAAPKFTAKLVEDFSQHGPTFVNDLKSYVLQHERKVLADLVKANGGITVVLNGIKVVLQHKIHFYLDARDKK